MGTVTTSDGTEIYYKDWGSGQPIVFRHGWPLSSDDWDAQMMFFLGTGTASVAHDRRGHGRSTQTATGTTWTTTPTTSPAVVEHSISMTPCTSATRPAAAKWRAMWPVTARAG